MCVRNSNFHPRNLNEIEFAEQVGLPKTAEQSIVVAKKLVDAAEGMGLSRDNIFIDPLARAVAVENEQGRAFLDAAAGILESRPGVHIICGLSKQVQQVLKLSGLDRSLTVHETRDEALAAVGVMAQ